MTGPAVPPPSQVPPPNVPVVPPPPVTLTVHEAKRGPGLLVRALWFVFIGWWLTAITSAVAWVAMITILGLPLGIWLINRIPTVLTLRPRTETYTRWSDGTRAGISQSVAITQQPWWIRGLWFIVVGWWASALVMTIGFFLIVIIITIPIGLMLYNRVPFVASLYRY